MHNILRLVIVPVGLVAGMLAANGPVVAQTDPPPESMTFEFGSLGDRGAYEHCVALVSADPDVLEPGDETCFVDAKLAQAFAESGTTQFSSRGLFESRRVAIHYQGHIFTGATLSMGPTQSGKFCEGGGVTLTGTRYDNWISSTESGCSLIEHYDISQDFVFEGQMEPLGSSGGNLTYMNNRTSGVLSWRRDPDCERATPRR